MGARKLRLKNRENPKIVFSARVSSLPLSVKHWFFFLYTGYFPYTVEHATTTN